jgi:hypothetical protein
MRHAAAGNALMLKMATSAPHHYSHTTAAHPAAGWHVTPRDSPTGGCNQVAGVRLTTSTP